MAQQTDPTQQAISYMRHQAGKGLDSLAALIERTQADWERCLEGMSDGQANFHEAGEWSAKEVLAHVLIATAGVNRQISAAAAGCTPDWPFGAPGSTNAEAESYSSKSIAELRRQLVTLFEETGRLAASFGRSPHLDAAFQHPFFGQLNIQEWIAFQRIHAMDHIQQLEKIKADPAYPAR